MVICPDCGKEVPNAKFCKNCGARLPEVEEVVEEVVPISEEINEVEEAVPVAEVEEAAEEEVPVSEDVKKVIPVSEEVDDVAEEIVIAPKSSEKTESSSSTVNNEVKFCHNCGFKLEGNFKFCPNCGYDLEQRQPASSNTKVVAPTKEKNIIISIILSIIFPGLGQIYLGLDKKGSMFLIGYVISIVLCLFIIGFVLCFVIWIWALVDTIQSTNALNRGESVEDKLF